MTRCGPSTPQQAAQAADGWLLGSQSVNTTAVPGARGFDKAKLINGRKRHLFVDTLGLLLAVVVTAASVQERDGAPAAGHGPAQLRERVSAGYA
jgi:hypothetical protein